MITKIKTVYYCEYCKHKVLTSSAMKIHEKHCTMNPERFCRLCQHTLKITEQDKHEHENINENPTAKGDYTIEDYWGKLTIWHLSCPLCAFSIYRQYGIPNLKFPKHFPLKEEIEEYWENQRMEDYGSYGL